MKQHGFSLIELLVVVALTVILAGATIPFAHATIDRSRTAGAAAYVASRLMLARFEAVNRSQFVAIQFVRREDGLWFRPYIDGNRNGVLSRDIARGTDRPLGPEERLDDQYPGVGFGICAGVTGVVAGDPFDANDPIQIGQSTLMSFNPNGSSTAGTLYIRGTHANQFAVRVLGVTARSRVFEFNFQDHQWRTH